MTVNPKGGETASFVKDVIGPKGSIRIGGPPDRTGSSDIDSHTQTGSLLRHDAASMTNVRIDAGDEPDHRELCNREQAYLLDAIEKDLDLRDPLAGSVNSLRIVLAGDESVRPGAVIHLT